MPPLAQLVEHTIRNRVVACSIHAGGTIKTTSLAEFFFMAKSAASAVDVLELLSPKI